jgi:hypothetical protein
LTSGELLVARNITIAGPGAENLAVNGNAKSGVFHVKPIPREPNTKVSQKLFIDVEVPEDWMKMCRRPRPETPTSNETLLKEKDLRNAERRLSDAF